jgi:hypothetical protein
VTGIVCDQDIGNHGIPAVRTDGKNEEKVTGHKDRQHKKCSGQLKRVLPF